MGKKYDEYGFRINPKKKINKKDRSKIEKNASRGIIYTVIIVLIIIICFIASFFSGYIAWNCYANNLKTIRVIKTILAAIFFYMYLPYFILLRVVLKVPCF
jgi:heme/copper-type cytochrome/quinol oxidase subunit 2